MSNNARKLNRPRLASSRLRPRLESEKQRYDALHPEDVIPDTGVANPAAGETSRPDPVPEILTPGQVEANNRLRRLQPLRPAVRDIIFPPSERPAPEELWGKARSMPGADAAAGSSTAANSSAALWGSLLVVFIALVWGAGFILGFQTSLIILLSVGLILSVVGLASPSLGLLAIGMVAALDAMANIFLFTGGVLRYNTVNYWLLLVIILFIPFVLRLRDLNSRTLQIFLAMMFLELAFSVDRSAGIQDILNIGATFGMVVYIARALDDELAFYWLGIVNGFLAGLGGLVFFLQINKLPYANPNDWTYFQLTALFSICIAYPFAVKYHKSRFVLLLFAALNFTWIFLSGSRGSLLIAMLAIAYLFMATRSLSWKMVMVVVAIMIGLWVSLNFSEQQVTTISRIQLLFDTSQSAARRTSERSLIAQAGLAIFHKYPLGIGTGSFADVSITTGYVGSNRPAHSAWIQVLAENGVLGVVLLAAFIASFAVVGFRKHQEGKLLFALFITIVFAGAFIAKEFRGKSLWFLAASGIVLLHPEAMLTYLHRRAKHTGENYLQQLKKARFGGR